MRATRSVVLAGVLAILVVGGTLTAFIDPSTVSAAVAQPHPVRPQMHRLRLAGVDQAALAERFRQAILRKQRDPKLLMRLRKVRIERKRSTIFVHGFGRRALSLENSRKVEMQMLILRRQH